MWYIYILYRSSTTENIVGKVDFDLTRSLMVKCDGAIELPIFGFLLMFNSNMWPNSTPLRDYKASKSE